MTTPLILITNDDGYHCIGLEALAEAMNAVGEVWVCAPDRERSAVSHAISLNTPLRVHEVHERFYRIDGTPADCVLLGARDIVPRKPDLVMSGINTGPNLGDDVTYSGTVAGAYEGMLQGIPSIAISNASYNASKYDDVAQVGVMLAKRVLERGIPENTMLNVNVPEMKVDDLNGFSITRQGRRNYGDEIHRREDPRGRPYFWIGGFRPEHIIDPGTDFEAIEQGKVSITPLHRDITHHNAIDALRDWNGPASDKVPG